MFNDCGNKIQIAGRITFILGIISSVVYGIVMLVQNQNNFFLSLLIMILGFFAFWVISLIIVGFGIIVKNSNHNTNIIEKNHCNNSNRTKNDDYICSPNDAVEPTTISEKEIKCPKCGFIQASNRKCCWKCGIIFTDMNQK